MMGGTTSTTNGMLLADAAAADIRPSCSGVESVGEAVDAPANTAGSAGTGTGTGGGLLLGRVGGDAEGGDGGMEYPMICFNGPRPEEDDTYTERTKYGLISVIIHEVGHNWFPMIINSDERQWTWMDEGLNTYLQFLDRILHCLMRMLFLVLDLYQYLKPNKNLHYH